MYFVVDHSLHGACQSGLWQICSTAFNCISVEYTSKSTTYTCICLSLLFSFTVSVFITFFHRPVTLPSFTDYVLPHLSRVQSHKPKTFNHFLTSLSIITNHLCKCNCSRYQPQVVITSKSKWDWTVRVSINFKVKLPHHFWRVQDRETSVERKFCRAKVPGRDRGKVLGSILCKFKHSIFNPHAVKQHIKWQQYIFIQTTTKPS